MIDGSTGTPTSRRHIRTTIGLALLAAVIFWRLARREPARTAHPVKVKSFRVDLVSSR